LLNHKLQLFPKSHNYENSDTVTDENQLKITENFYLPLSIGSSEEKEYYLEKKLYTEEEAKQRAQENLNSVYDKLKEKGVQISENSVKIEIGKESCKVSGGITVIEKIGQRIDTTIIDEPEERIMDEE
jgi:similar to stage IV sporulation protein